MNVNTKHKPLFFVNVICFRDSQESIKELKLNWPAITKKKQREKTQWRKQTKLDFGQ